MPNAKIDEFLQRIQANLTAAEAEKYAIQKIDPQDQGILNTALSQKIFTNTFSKILTDSSIQEQLTNLKPGGQIAIKREPNSPDYRSFNIVMDDDGEVCLFIEPKSKRFDNTRRFLKWVGGSYKTRKICARADTPQAQVYVSLIEYVDSDANEVLRVKNELSIMQKFKGIPGFPMHTLFGGLRFKIRDGETKQRIITYMPYMPSTLDNYLKGSWSPPGIDFSDIEKKALNYDIMQQLIDIVTILQKNEIEHKDLKPENFLMKYDYDQGRFKIEIIDFGLAKRFNERETEFGTPTYLPPWVMKLRKAGKKVSDLMTDQDFRVRYLPSLGWLLLHRQFKDEIPIEKPKLATKGEHDVWSLGVIFDLLLNGSHDVGSRATIRQLEAIAEHTERNIYKSELLKQIFNLNGKNAHDIERRDVPDITKVKQIFAADPEANAALKELPALTKRKYDTELAKSQEGRGSGVDFDFYTSINAIDNYSTLIDSLLNPATTKEERDKVLENILQLSFIGTHAVSLKLIDFNKYFNHDDYSPLYLSLYNTLRNFERMAIDKVKVTELENYDLELNVQMQKIESAFKAKNRLPPDEWLIYARLKLFVLTAQCLTYKRLETLQNNPNRDSKSNWFFLGKRSSKALSGPPTNYQQLIQKHQQEIAELLPSLKVESGPKNFNSEFSRKNL